MTDARHPLRTTPPPARRRRRRRVAEASAAMPASATMREAAKAAGKSETLERYAARLSARARTTSRRACARPSARCASGLRMRRTATVLSGSACCVYGLTFTSHFYGAQAHRRLRAVQLRDAGHRQAVRGHPRGGVQARRPRRTTTPIVVINLCVPTASGVPLRLLPQGDQRRAHHRHRRAGLRRADPCRGQGRAGRRDAELRPPRGRAGPGAGAARAARREADGHAARRDVPGRSGRDRRACSSRWASPPARSCRRANGASSMRALDCAAVAAIHPFYTASVREFEPAGRPVVGSAPVGVDGTAAWLEAIGAACGVAGRHGSTRPRPSSCRRSRRALAATPIKGRITLSGYEGSELLVARLLVESGADVRYVGTACPRTRWSRPTTANGSRRRASQVQYRASLEQDCAAMRRIRARPRDRHDAGRAEGQGARDPGALLHQPDLGAAADGRRPARARSPRSSTPRSASKGRFDAMREFFEGVGDGPCRRRLGGRSRATGPSSRRKRRSQGRQAATVEEMGSC